MRRNLKYLVAFACLSLSLLFAACGGKSEAKHGFVGKFTDEFGNKFELRSDYTATIQFVGDEKVNETKWHDGPLHDSPFATIEFNGNPVYYYLRDGVLYRHKEDMDSGRCAIKIDYE